MAVLCNCGWCNKNNRRFSNIKPITTIISFYLSPVMKVKRWSGSCDGWDVTAVWLEVSLVTECDTVSLGGSYASFWRNYYLSKRRDIFAYQHSVTSQ
jgi:hypothetical protein